MWAQACALLDEAERRHRRFFDLLAAPCAAPAWEPPADVFRSESEVHVRVTLPGARPEDVDVRIIPAGLVIETRVPAPVISASMRVVRLEIPYGLMRRHIELPPGRYALRERRFENGNLHLRVAEHIP
jgi:HSP20 family molecular chaperone IbpA